jgi:hypothetical protein
MKYIPPLSLLVLLAGIVDSNGQSNPNIHGFVPQGWSILEEVRGDLNKDSIDDVAMVIEDTIMGDADFQKRAILVLFKNKKDQRYELMGRGDKAILTAEDGGILGDPYSGIKIKKGILQIDFLGGSRDKWNLTYKYRFQNGDFYLIGATNKGGNGIQSYSYDYNLSNGKIVIVVKDPENKKNNMNQTSVVKQMQLPSLRTFECWSLSLPEFGPEVSF